MPKSRYALLLAARSALLLLALGAMYVADGFALKGVHSDFARGILMLVALGVCVPRNALLRPAVPLLVLAADLVAIGTVGVFLRLDRESTSALPAPSLAFLTGYVVTVLVATGRRVGSAALGIVTGVMLLMLGEGLFVPPDRPEAAGRGATPAAAAAAADRAAAHAREDRTLFDRSLFLRILLLLGVAVECAVVIAWVDADGRRRRSAESIERELRARGMIADEVAQFANVADRAVTAADLCDLVVGHVRRFFPTRARGVVLEDAGGPAAVWEELARLDPERVEARRERLQNALRESGSNLVVDRVAVRSTAGKIGSVGDRFGTSVSVPVHANGRVAGIVLVADAHRGALAEDRIGALAELARAVGDAVVRIERRREEQRRRTQLLMGQMREGVLLLGTDGKVLLANPAAKSMLEAIGQPAEGPVTLGDAGPEDLASVGAGHVRRVSVVDESPGRRAIRLAVSAVGVVDEGVRLGTLVTMSDVTDEEHARQRLLQSEKLSVVGQTLASVAHELNNPLAAIVGYADLLHDSDVAPEVAKILGRIREQATRTSRIVKNLLSVARRRGPERSRVDLNEVAHSVIDLFAYEARLSNITIHVDLDAALPVVYADRHALQQLLVNLVQNAIHALRSAERPDPARPRSISVRTRAQSDGAALSVADDGPGVPVENRERVFEPFFTTKGSDQGTGLGLAIARGIAREHGGDLVLESRSDGLSGAVFTLRLPFAEGAAAREPAASPIPDGVPAHVLLVDDEAPVRDSLSAQLVRMGAHVDSAGTPLEASRLLESSAPYDVVLMDLRLPGQSGLDLHRTLAARNPDLARRVVFMTGDLVNDDLLKAVRATGNLLLEKPFTADELREALAKAQPRA